MTRNYKNIIITQNQYNLIAEGINSHLCYYNPIEIGEYVAIYGDKDEKMDNPIHVIITDSKRDGENFPEYRFQKIAEEKKPDTTLADALNGLAKAFFACKLMDMRWRLAMAGVSVPNFK